MPPDLAEIIKEKEAQITKLERKNDALTSLLKQEVAHKESISRALRHHLNKNEALINAVPWIVLQISKKCTYVEVNRYYATLLNAETADFADKAIGAFNEPLPFTSIIRQFVVSDGLKTSKKQIVFSREGLDKHFFLILFRNKIDGHVAVIGIDISDRVETEKELIATRHYLQQANKKLQEKVTEAERLTHEAQSANTAKSNFLSTMSHELRTPLNGIIGMASLLTGTHHDEEMQECIEVILSSADSLEKVIGQILDISKIEAGKIELEQIPLDVPGLISDVARMFGFQAKERGVELLTDIQRPLPDASLIGDPIRLKQILINFLHNAFKFTQEGRIIITATCIEETGSAAHLYFTVTDTGIGISPENKANLFKPFFQSDSSISRKYGGSGLGLAICKELAKLMDGKIGVESTPGRGSTFYFSLWLQKSPVQY